MVGDIRSDALEAELFLLQQQQRAALENATYVGMDSQELHEYDCRAERVAELQRRFGVKPDDRNELW